MIGSLVALILSLSVLLGFAALSVDYLESTAPTTPPITNTGASVIQSSTSTPKVVRSSRAPEPQVRRSATTTNIEKQTLPHVVSVGPLETNISLEHGTLSTSGVLTYTNLARSQNGNLKPLVINETLNTIAMHKLDDMFQGQYFEHISPSGIGPSELARQYGYEYIYVAENLAQGNFDNDAKLVGAWMTSTGHRANILNAHYQEIGLAVKKGIYNGKEVWMAVQTFGRAVSSCPTIDKVLQSNIDTHNADLARMSKDLDIQKSALDLLVGDMEKYSQELKKYEEAISVFNALVAETDALIKVYNAQVRAYNTCVTVE